MEITKELRESQTLKFSQLAREMNRRGERILSLGLGEPAFETPEPIITEVSDALKKGYTKYSNSYGLVELRELISDKLLKENSISVPPGNIVVTPGAKQALLLALMAILKPYDEVINIVPCYVSYVPQIKIAEPRSVIRNIDLNKDNLSIDWEKIRKVLSDKTRVIILNSPHNPTGQMLSGQPARSGRRRRYLSTH